MPVNPNRDLIEDIYPLTPTQQGMLLYTLAAPQSGIYLLQTAYRLQGNLDLAAFQRAWEQVIARHPALRTCLVWEGLAEPVQVVLARAELPMDSYDWRGLPVFDQQRQWEELVLADRRRGFDLSQAPLMRLTLVRLVDDTFHLIWSRHHIVFDGWSIVVILKEVFAIYEALRRSEAPDLARPRPYRDYIHWLRQQDLSQSELHWREVLRSFRAPTRLDVDRAPGDFFMGVENFAEQLLSLPAPVAAALEAGARQYQLTLPTLILGAWAVLLSRYSGEDDIVFGAAVYGRPAELAGVDEMVGLFVNVLPVRVQVFPDSVVGPWLKSLQAQQAAAQSHAFSPLVQIQGWSEIPRGQPLFESTVTFENFPVADTLVQAREALTVQVLQSFDRTNYPLSLFVLPGPELGLRCTYDPRHFDAPTIQRWLGQLQTVLVNLLENPERRLVDLPLLTEAERHQMLVAWNDTRADYSRATCIHELFEAQVVRAPDSVALVFEAQSPEGEPQQLTYGELNRRANQLAHWLRDHHPGSGTRVGVWLNRGTGLIAGLLGVLKAGGAYVPLDPAWPVERVAGIAAALGLPCLLTDLAHLKSVYEVQGRLPKLASVICLDVLTAGIPPEPLDLEVVRAFWDRLAAQATDAISAGGFISSYTGGPFTSAEVEAYQARVVQLAQPFVGPTKRVLEIGCGSGLMMFALAPQSYQYVGLDPSAVMQARNQARAAAQGLAQIELVTAFAHEVDSLAPGAFDLILLASTAQFFPGPVYLRHLLATLVRWLAPGGAIVIADVLDAKQKEVFRQTLEAYKRQHSDAPNLRTKTNLESELYLDEGFFADVAQELGGVLSVTILHREAAFENELRYRYDVVLQKTRPGQSADLSQHPGRFWTAGQLAGMPTHNLPRLAAPVDTAYIIHTSGSTGVPKGVVICHASVVNLIEWVNQTFQVTPDDRLLFVTSPCFDLSVYDLFGLLAAGGSIQIASEADLRDPERLLALLTHRPITFWDSAPAALQQLTPFFAPGSIPAGRRHLRRVFLSGDWIPVPLPDLVRSYFPQAEVISLGGATEATIWSNYYRIDKVDASWVSIPYGKPIQNARYYILDSSFNPCPMGVSGDLYIGGECLALGYANDPILTAEKFVPDPLQVEGSLVYRQPGARLYKTGDRARYWPDGTIEFLGRTDHQVKIRGFRVELGEIETTLARHPAVQTALVTIHASPGEPRASRWSERLAAYVVPQPELAATPEQTGLLRQALRAFLLARLPQYMVPALFVFLPRLPVTPNGKVDRQALPRPDGLRPDLEAVYVAPQNEIERVIAQIWQEVLQVERVGRGDNFFDLGGHSLMLVQVYSKLRTALQRDLSLIDLFHYPTVSDLARALTAAPETPPTRAAEPDAPQQPAKAPDAAGIAIVGMMGRFPGARTLDEFWQNLSAGVESISFFSIEELAAAGVEADLLDDPGYVRARGVLADVDRFAAAFFGYTPREAEIMDPQQRLFLECAWEALENAGYAPHSQPTRVGVYAGLSLNSYLLSALYPEREQLESAGAFQATISNDKDFLATRVSYKLNLKGPSLTVQTACSTSLVAVGLACQSLLDHHCDIALAGGVSIVVPQKAGYLYQEGGILSPDGHCRAFDARAQGCVGGDGVGIVVLKRLDDALAAGDSILAVIKGVAINNDGADKVGYTAPSVPGQAAVIGEALAMAGCTPDTIGYVEAHGTGTPLGDPIELAALTLAYRRLTARSGYCALGSVKTNIGHLDAAAGVAGLIKTVLSLQHRQIPPSLHFEQPNPQIDFAHSPFFVNTRLRDWPAGKTPRRAAVSSFGLGGTNAHVILEEAPVTPASGSTRPWQLLTLSAKTAPALERATLQLAHHLENRPGLNLADVAYTLQVGRTAFEHRRVVVCRDMAEAVTALTGQAQGRLWSEATLLRQRPVIFLFPGGGAHYPTMGRDLYLGEPVFREQIDRCAEYLRLRLGMDLRQHLYPAGDPAPGSLRQPSVALTALFAVEYALAQLWLSWGVRPQAMLGHSLGEYVAACLAGVFSLEDALALVALRGQLFEQLPPGAMISVPLAEPELLPRLGSALTIAAVNQYRSCVVSGPAAAIAALETSLLEEGLDVRRLPIEVAAHSQMLEPIVKPFTDFVAGLPLHPPQIALISNVTGTWMTAAAATDPAYWGQHLRQTVRFDDGLKTLGQEPESIFLEVGPGRTLAALAAGADSQRVVLTSMRQPREQQSDHAFLLATLGRLWLAGAAVDWPGYFAQEERRRLSLPTYPFERERYWVEPPKPGRQAPTRAQAPSKRPDMADWFYISAWKRSTPPALLGPADSTPRSTPWLVFVERGGLGDRLARRLEQLGHSVITVEAGEHFSRIDPRRYALRPHSSEDYKTLLHHLGAPAGQPMRIAHCWNVTPANDAPLDRRRFEESQAVGFYSLLFLAQALGEQRQPVAQRLYILSTQVHNVTGEDLVQPEKATLLGPCRVLPQEQPGLACCNIDLTLPQADSPAAGRLIHQLVDEMLAKTTEPVVAYRGGQRWVQIFEPVRLDEAPPARLPLRSPGVYLITGGLGGIGLVLAEYLARAAQARLILVGRSAPPHPEETVQALEALGAEVMIASGDVADETQMRHILAQAQARFGPLNGVIHCAGVPGGGLIQLGQPDRATPVFAPKVYGTLVLEALLREVRLDFFVLCSSLNAIVGGIGQVDYCAANAFLDSFAHAQAVRGQPNTLSINWDTWQQVGMAVGAQLPLEFQGWRADLIKQKGILPREGEQVFRRLLGSGLPQAVVSTEDLPRVLARYKALASTSLVETLKPALPTRPQHPRPMLGTPYEPPGGETERQIADLWEQLLGIAGIGIHDNFLELGGHSLLATQIVSRMRELFSLEFSLRSFFETPTIAGLAQAVAVRPAGPPPADGPDPDVIPRRSQTIDQELAELERLSESEATTRLATLTPQEPPDA